MPNEQMEPLFSMRDIEKLAWSTSKRVKDDETVIVTKFTFEAEPTAGNLKTLHNLLKHGGPLSVTFRSPKIQVELEVGEINESKAAAGELTEEP